jgi:hypothetical protein
MTSTNLLPEEWEHLRQMSLGSLRMPLTDEAKQRLIEAGYVVQRERGVELTPVGEAAVERHFARPD